MRQDGAMSAADDGEGDDRAGVKTDTEADAEANAAAPPRPDGVNARSDAALASHAQRMRRLRRMYAAALAVLTAAAIAIFVVEYTRGEISHTSLHPVASPPPSVALKPPSGQLTKAWSSADVTAIGTPYYNGTVVTHDAHTVRGRDALTGQETWSYTRTDRTVCAAIQNDGVTIAVYRLDGNCDELTAVDTDTGQRKWTRTLDKDGAVFDGPATYSVQPDNVMLVSRTSIYALADQNDGGLDWWTFYHPGCTINSAILGAAGALISQTCHGEHCAGKQFCGNGRQLLLRQAEAGTSDSKTNPDQIVWNKRNTNLQPALAGQHVAARDPSTRKLVLLEQKSGKVQAQLPLAESDASASAFSSTIDADLFWTAGHTYALKTNATAFAWQAATSYLPTAVSESGSSNTSLAKARLAAPASSGIVTLDGGSGSVGHRYTVAAPPPGSLVYPFGSGFVVAGPSTTVYR
jgi:outer membrane protein assembly factor BamB